MIHKHITPHRHGVREDCKFCAVKDGRHKCTALTHTDRRQLRCEVETCKFFRPRGKHDETV